MRPMTNVVNILRSMARQNPAWREDPRWQQGMRRMRKLARKFRKERANARNRETRPQVDPDE